MWTLIFVWIAYVNACELTCENVDDDMQDVIEQLSDLGYNVAVSYFEVYDAETSNVYIPFARDDTDYLISQFDNNFAHTRFGGEDAIIFRGCTPQSVTYFGYRSYSAVRINKSIAGSTLWPTEYTVLGASLGDTLNQKVIQTESSDITSFDMPFDRKTNIVTCSDEQTWTDVYQSFANAGLLTENAINLDAINNIEDGWFQYSQSELDVPRDTISIVYRIQWDENSECNKEQYLNQSFPLYRFYKDSKEPSVPINRELRNTIDPGQQCENTPENKKQFRQVVSNIIEHMKNEYNYLLMSDKPLQDNVAAFVNIFQHGYYCISNQLNCMFDNRDTYYSWDKIAHLLNDNEFYLVVGLNHNNYGLSVTNSISLSTVYNPDNGNAFEMVDIITNEEYEEFDIRNIMNCIYGCPELVDNVFAVQVARPQNCINVITSSMCLNSDILGMQDEFIFFGETTLNEVTQTMPAKDCLIEWRLLKFKIFNESCDLSQIGVRCEDDSECPACMHCCDKTTKKKCQLQPEKPESVVSAMDEISEYMVDINNSQLEQKAFYQYPMFWYILLIGAILFVLINNLFIGFWCVCRNVAQNGEYHKYHVDINDE